jgi:NDMA-dependent alcohol dehydrogenase
MGSSFRAAVLYEENQPFQVEEIDLADPGPGEVVVALKASGVCHSDWNTQTGVTPSPLPAILGHEGAGVVEEVGPGVTSVKPGDHVALSWLPACGRCFYCVQGRPSLCSEAMPYLLAGTLMGGEIRYSLGGRPIHHYSFISTFADTTIVPEASCIRIPDDVPLEVAAVVGCAVLTGVGAVLNRAQVQAGSVVLIYGAGGVGLSAVQAARMAGAGAVVVVDPLPSKRALALELGATHAVDPAVEDAGEVARSLTQGRGADYAFDAAGAPPIVPAAFGAIRRGGTLVCIGIPAADAQVALPGPPLVRDEKIVTGSLYGSCRPVVDVPRILEAYKAGRLDLDRLLSRRYELEEINSAFDDMVAGEVVRGVITLGG